jgi:hypothetical protein
MRCLPFVAALALVGAARPAIGQPCAPPPRPFFEFEVTQPVEYTGDTTLALFPTPERYVDAREDPGALVVQFVVDTLGRAEERSFHVLHAPSAAAGDSVRAVLARWRFAPAEQNGCRVSQLLQTAVQH